MARTIGKVNIRLVQKVTRQVKQEREDNYQNLVGIDNEVMDKLPESIFDTWESAYSEVQRIIHDTMWETI